MMSATPDRSMPCSLIAHSPKHASRFICPSRQRYKHGFSYTMFPGRTAAATGSARVNTTSERLQRPFICHDAREYRCFRFVVCGLAFLVRLPGGWAVLRCRNTDSIHPAHRLSANTDERIGTPCCTQVPRRQHALGRQSHSVTRTRQDKTAKTRATPWACSKTEDMLTWKSSNVPMREKLSMSSQSCRTSPPSCSPQHATTAAPAPNFG